MSENKDYAALALSELLAEEKKIKQQEITAAVIIGFLVGVMIYGVAKSGFGFIYIAIPLLLIYGIYKYAQRLKHNLKQIQAEINTRKPA